MNFDNDPLKARIQILEDEIKELREKIFFGMKAIVKEDGLCYFEDGTIIDPSQTIEEMNDEEMNINKFDNDIDKAVANIAENHRKIIDDWCKAYLAQLYEEGINIKPGSFTLIEQEFGLYNGKYCKRYWFEVGKPQF